MKWHIGLIVACMLATGCAQTPAAQTIDFGPGAGDTPAAAAPVAATPVDQGAVPAAPVEPAPVTDPGTPIPVEPDFPIGGPVPGGGGGGLAEPTMPVTDAYYLIELRRDQRSGIALADLAILNSGDVAVDGLATDLRDDHESYARDIDDVAEERGAPAASGLSEEGVRWTRRIQEQESLEGDFVLEEVYARAIVELLEKDVAMTRFVATSGADAAVRELAAQLLPALENNLEDARDLAERFGVDDEDDE